MRHVSPSPGLSADRQPSSRRLEGSRPHLSSVNRSRSVRDVTKLKLAPRSAEIQRLIGRSLRGAVDLQRLG